MKNSVSLLSLMIASALSCTGAAWAQTPDQALRVVRAHLNAETENAELCIEFDKPLATTTPSRLASALKLEENGKTVTPPNLTAAASSLCLFPLDRGTSYSLTVTGLRGAGDERMASSYIHDFSVPDRSPQLSFAGYKGSISGFALSYKSLTLHSVNVPKAKIEIYRVADAGAMARAWIDRALTAIAPTESAYLARDKGKLVWSGDLTFSAAANATQETSFSVADKIPDLPPGLYLAYVDSGPANGKPKKKPAQKGLAPSAALWFTNTTYTLRAVRDNEGIYAFTPLDAAVKVTAWNKDGQQIGEFAPANDGVSFLSFASLKDKTKASDIAALSALDAAGNVAFADIRPLPEPVTTRKSGTITLASSFAVPGETITLSLATDDASPAESGSVRLSRKGVVYGEFPVPQSANAPFKMSIPAPAQQGEWTLEWHMANGTVLSTASLRVTADPDAPSLAIDAANDYVSGGQTSQLSLKSTTASGKAAPLITGSITAGWQVSDAKTLGWPGYSFGVPATIVNAQNPAATFLTDENGAAQVKFTLPKPPQEPGFYQAVIMASADPDLGVAASPPLVLPLRGDAPVVGLKPLVPQARFPQNGLARFSVIALSPDGKSRESSSLSYQIFEEGRSFGWYQNDGRWDYRREPQLRPIGGGALTVKADGSTLIEAPITAGNYLIEVQDSTGKVLARTPFSAGWVSNNEARTETSLHVTLPSQLMVGRKADAKFTLPEAATVVAVVTDGHVRKTIHEKMPKGENTLSFTPTADWKDSISVTVEVPETDSLSSLAGEARAALSRKDTADNGASGQIFVRPLIDPSGIQLHKGDRITLTFVLDNDTNAPKTLRYGFTTTAGLKIENGNTGSVNIAPGQSRPVSVSLLAEQAGEKDLRLQLSGIKTETAPKSWHIAVSGDDGDLRTVKTVTVEAQKDFASAPNDVLLIAPHPLAGLPELLSLLVQGQPSTTREISDGIRALHSWEGPIARLGLLSPSALDARQYEWRLRLIKRQNADGGFGPLRGSESTIEDTARAVFALDSDESAVKMARGKAVSWLKDRLANTWFDEHEREERAIIYAALASADTQDVASLRYFSDTSTSAPLSPIAKAYIAAAFRHLRDFDAAAFWIKKMSADNKPETTPELLAALAATDALSSDDTLAAVKKYGENPATDFLTAAELLRAAARNAANAGKFQIVFGGQPHSISGVAILRGAEMTGAKNDAGKPLAATYAAYAPAHDAPAGQGATISRHIYRMNGVEVTPPSRPLPGETYIVELKGNAPATKQGKYTLIQDSAHYALRPTSCSLSAHLDTLAIIPWFSAGTLTPVSACETTAFGIDIVLPQTMGTDRTFRTAYFARFESVATTGLPQPEIRYAK